MTTKNTKINKNEILCGAFLFLSAFIMSLNANSFPFSGKLSGTDSSVFRYVASVIADGGMPYFDTFDHKGPILYLINVLGLLISESFGLWLIEFLFILIIFIFAYKIARLINCNHIASCAVVGLNVLTLVYYFEGGNLVEEYACAFLMFSLYVFLEFFITSQTNPLKLVLCGISFAAVCLLRLNMVVLWGVMCVGVLIYCIRSSLTKKIFGFVLWFLLGMALVFIPIITWLWIKGALTSFVENYWFFNLTYSSDPTRSSSINKIIALVKFSIDIPVATIAPILIYFCFTRKNGLSDWMCLISLVLSLISMCLSGQTYKHYGMILCPIIVYTVSRVFAEIEANLLSPSNKVGKLKVFGTVVSLLCAVVLLFSTSEVLLVENILHLSAHHDITTDEYQIAEIVKSNSNADDKISVCGNRNIIYLLAERESISKYSYQSPIASVDSKIKKEYLADIKELKPKLIIVYENMFLYDELLGIIESDYKIIATVGTANVYKIIT